MVKTPLKNTCFSLIVLILFFTLVEILLWPWVPTGSYDFIERRLMEEGVSARKPREEFRILFFGESTMHGSHLYPQSTIPLWTGRFLNTLVPEADAYVKAVNLGRLGEDSEFILRALKETLVYKPDLVVVYSAHNDFIILEHRDRYLREHSLSERLTEGIRMLSRKSRLVSALKRVKVRSKLAREDKDEASAAWYDERARAQYKEGLRLLPPDSRDRAFVMSQWKRHIEGMIAVAEAHDIPIVFISQISRYPGFPPFQSRHAPSLSRDQLKVWQNAVEQGEERLKAGQAAAALSFFEQARGIDDMHAMLDYRMAEALRELGRYEEAAAYYRSSSDKDHFPIRGPSSVNDVFRAIAHAQQKGVHVIDGQALLAAQAQDGILDTDLVADQLHPTMKGQILLSTALVRLIQDQGVWMTDRSWAWERLPDYGTLRSELERDQDFLFQEHIFTARYVGSYLDQAVAEAEAALKIKPDALDARSLLAWLLYINGQKERALLIYEELRERYPEPAEVFLGRNPEILAELTGAVGHFDREARK